MPRSRSQLIVTADAFCTAYSRWTVPDVLSIRSPTCTHCVLPGDQPPRNNRDSGEILNGVIPVKGNIHLQPVDTMLLIVDGESRRLMKHLTSTAETDVGPHGKD